MATGFRATARGADSRDLAVRLVGVVAIRSRSRPDVVERFYERCRPRSTLEARPASGEAGARSTTRDEQSAGERRAPVGYSSVTPIQSRRTERIPSACG